MSLIDGNGGNRSPTGVTLGIMGISYYTAIIRTTTFIKTIRTFKLQFTEAYYLSSNHWSVILYINTMWVICEVSVAKWSTVGQSASHQCQVRDNYQRGRKCDCEASEPCDNIVVERVGLITQQNLRRLGHGLWSPNERLSALHAGRATMVINYTRPNTGGNAATRKLNYKWIICEFACRALTNQSLPDCPNSLPVTTSQLAILNSQITQSRINILCCTTKTIPEKSRREIHG